MGEVPLYTKGRPKVLFSEQKICFESFRTRQNFGRFVPAVEFGVRMRSSPRSGREGLLGHVPRVIKKTKVHPYRGSWLQDLGCNYRDSA
jgi:hypothetical protein